MALSRSTYSVDKCSKICYSMLMPEISNIPEPKPAPAPSEGVIPVEGTAAHLERETPDAELPELTARVRALQQQWEALQNHEIPTDEAAAAELEQKRADLMK